MLHDFTLDDLKSLTELNKAQKKYQPSPLDLSNYKKCVPEYHLESPALSIDYNTENVKMQNVLQYFNKNMPKQSYYNLQSSTVDLEALMGQLDKESFFMYRFKTEMCPHIKIKHNYKDCLYFHNPKDYRRKPDFLRYYPENCSNGANCPFNPYCVMSHSLFENLYHPLKYKVNFCDKMVRDVHSSMLYCIRGDRCAFYHDENDRRKVASNGCKLNNQDDAKSNKSTVSSQSYHSRQENQKFVPFSPYEEISPEVDVYQRRHARSDIMAHPLPSLSQPIAVGVSHPMQKIQPRHDGFNYPHSSRIPNNQYMMNYRMTTNYNISPVKQRSNYGSESASNLAESSENMGGPIYNNQLFEGNTIPSRQTSYSENSAYMFNRQMGRASMMNQFNVQNSRRSNLAHKLHHDNSHGRDSHAVESTTPSSELIKPSRASGPESDHLKYLFEGGLGYERRADSLKSPVPPGLTKYKMEENDSRDAKSQNDYSEQYHEKLDSKFMFTMHRKITEDREREDLSQNTSDNEDHENNKKPQSSAKKSKMCRSSTGFIPKHLRQPPTHKLSDEMSQQINFDINQLVDSTVNSRRQSEVSEEGQDPDTQAQAANPLSIEQPLEELKNN